MTVGRLAYALPIGLLLVAAWYQGAFAVEHWAPVGVLALVVLAGAAFAGGLRVPERAARWAVGALWALAAWALVSALWAPSPSDAIEGAARTALYAGLFTIAIALVPRGQIAARVGVALVAGIALIAVVTLVRLLGDGSDLFLAGRLDDPVGYRNATGCLFALGFWPCVAAAARHDVNAVLRGLALAAAGLLLGLGFLTQARGVALGLAAGGVVALALGPDRLRRAWLALLAVGAVAVASGSLMTPYDAFADGGDAVTAAQVATAVDALVVLTVALLAVGLVIGLLDGGLRLGGTARVALRQVLVACLVLVAVVGGVGALAVVGDPVDFVDARVQEFRDPEISAGTGTRLAFAGGQRSDLWRVALIELGDNPLHGVGEGGYRFDYYEERRTDRNLSEPHSFVLRIASELGAVGLLCFLAFGAALVAAVAASWRRATPNARRAASALLALGTVGFAQAAVDWLWLVPATTGLSLLALGLAVAVLRAPERPEGVVARRSLAARLVPGIALILAAAGIAGVYLGDLHLRDARAADPGRPAERLAAAERAETFAPWSVEPLYLQAGALEELGRRRAARARLRAARELEPRNFVTVALLGDLETRAGRRRAARGHYRRALALNPLDAGLRELAGRR